MALKVQDAIKLVANFDEKIKTRAISWNEKPDMYFQAVETLKEIIKNTEGDQIKFQDYGQMRQFMYAKQVLENVERTRLAMDIKVYDNPAMERKGLFTYKNLKKYLKEWEIKEKYLQIPPQFIGQAYGELKHYIDYLKKADMPAMEKQMLLARLEQKKLIPMAEQYFRDSLIESKRIYQLVLKDTEKKHETHPELLDNVFFTLREIPQHWRAPIMNIYYWLKYSQTKGENVFNQESVLAFVDGLLASQKISAEQRKEIQARRKQAEEEKEKEDKEMTKKKLAAADAESEKADLIRDADQEKWDEAQKIYREKSRRYRQEADMVDALNSVEGDVPMDALLRQEREAVAGINALNSDIEDLKKKSGGKI